MHEAAFTSERTLPAADNTVTELDDATLRAAQAGEEHACRALYGRYQARVFAFLRRMCGPQVSRVLVEDLLQETFLRAFRGLPRFRPSGSAKLSTWLLTIACRVALNEFRGRRSHTVPLDDTVVLISPEGSDHDARQRQLYQLLVKTLGGLSAEQRAVFLLREYHAMPYGEIATALGVDLGTVKSRLYRARRAIHEAIDEVCHG